VRDSTIGAEKPLGARGAAMTDCPPAEAKKQQPKNFTSPIASLPSSARNPR
jgi:hypothetical protein